MTLKPKIIFEDDNLLVIDKPAGIASDRSYTTKEGTVVDFLMSKLGNNGLERSGLAHRLDKDTSGILLVAKTPEWFTYLKKAFKAHEIKKTYTALVSGALTPDTGRIDIPLQRDMVDRTKFRPAKKGRTATTNYQVVKKLAAYTLINAMPITGRTHQIRVHLAAIGHPIVADAVYGRKNPGLGRQFLHAAQIEFADPSGRPLKFTSELPSDLTNFLDGAR